MANKIDPLHQEDELKDEKEQKKRRRRRIIILITCLLSCATLITAGTVIATMDTDCTLCIAGDDTMSSSTDDSIDSDTYTDISVHAFDVSRVSYHSAIGPNIVTNNPESNLGTTTTGITSTSRGVNNYCSHNCEHSCVNVNGILQCVCDLGFVLNEDEETCTDLGCNMQLGVKYPANHIDIIKQTTSDTAADCCFECTAEPLCTIWTWHSDSNICNIKQGNLSPEDAPMTAMSGGPALFS